MVINNILAEVKDKLKNLYGENLVEVILYGSYARGDYNEHSDIDLLVILKNLSSPGEEIDNIVDKIYDIDLKYNTLTSIIPITYDEYKKINSPLLLNIRKEDVVVE
jgi:predicted nucleotidyltransferase